MNPKFKDFLKSPEFQDSLRLLIEFLVFVFWLALFLPILWVNLSYHELFALFAIYKILLSIFYSSDPYYYDEDYKEKFTSLKKENEL